MKFSKILRTLFATAMLLGFVTANAKDYTIKIAENIEVVYAVNTSDKIAKLKGFYDATKTVKTFEVPSKITYKSGSKTYTLTVTKIGENAFGGSVPTKVVLPNTIVEIGSCAFYNGTIKTVNIPTKVEVIGELAYRDIKFDKVKIPATCRRIDHFAFYGAKIGELTFASGGSVNLTIGQGAFQGSNITSVILPARLTKLENRAFALCKSLKAVTFQGPISEITEWCFMGCTSLSYVGMVNGTTHICQDAFADCKALTDFPWYPSIQTIDSEAFRATGLVTANFNEGLKSISIGAFKGCDKLTAISFPSTLEWIGQECFYGCEALKDVTARAIVPAEVSTPSFPICAMNVPILVPNGSVEAYKKAAGWSRFDYSHYAGVDDILVDEADESEAVWYDLNGRRVNADELAPGIYVKVTGNKTEKVAVR